LWFFSCFFCHLKQSDIRVNQHLGKARQDWNDLCRYTLISFFTFQTVTACSFSSRVKIQHVRVRCMICGHHDPPPGPNLKITSTGIETKKSHFIVNRLPLTLENSTLNCLHPN